MNMDTQGTEGDNEDREFGATQHRPRVIRATVVPSLSQIPTQTQDGTLSSTQGVSGSALFALSQRPGGVGYSQQPGPEGVSLIDPATNLRRRILNPRVAHSQVILDSLLSETRFMVLFFIPCLKYVDYVSRFYPGYCGPIEGGKLGQHFSLWSVQTRCT